MRDGIIKAIPSSDGTSGTRSTICSEQDLAAVRDQVRSAVRFPGVGVEESHGHLGFVVRGKRFGWLLVDHHGDGRLTLALKAPPGEQEAVVGSRHGYFIPAYLGSKGLIGVDLAPSAAPDWNEIRGLLEQAWRITASKTAVAEWDRTRTPDETPQ